MSVPASAREQSTDEICRLVRAAAVQHRPITAFYDGRPRLLCPHYPGLQPVRRMASVLLSVWGETKDGPLPVSDEGIWRCLSLRKLSSVECVTGPWRTEPHAPQRCVEHIEVDADDYPGGDPQNGQ